MEKYSLENFQNNLISYTKKNSYFFEVLLTDFFCLYKNIDTKIIYVTKSNNDEKIDSIVIPKNSYIGEINIYCLQITTSKKNAQYLEAFKEIDPYSIKQYQYILPPEKDIKIKKVLLSFYSAKSYEDYKDDIEIIDSEKLFSIMFENAIRYKLLLPNNKLTNKYFENVVLREDLWAYLHRINAYDTTIINQYIYFFNLNLNFIKNGDFELLDNMLIISDSSIKDIIDVFKNVDKTKYDLLISSDFSLLNQIVKTYKCYNKINNNIIDLIFFLDSLRKSDNIFNNLEFKPTREYLSINNKNRCISYMPYNFSNHKNKKACFSFKCNFNDISLLSNSDIDKSIGEGRLLSTIEANRTINGLNHTGMYSTLIHPNLKDDSNLIKILLQSSILQLESTI